MNYEINLDIYTTFLIANGNRYSGVEMSKALKEKRRAPVHDSISRWLLKGNGDSEPIFVLFAPPREPGWNLF